MSIYSAFAAHRILLIILDVGYLSNLAGWYARRSPSDLPLDHCPSCIICRRSGGAHKSKATLVGGYNTSIICLENVWYIWTSISAVAGAAYADRKAVCRNRSNAKCYQFQSPSVPSRESENWQERVLHSHGWRMSDVWKWLGLVMNRRGWKVDHFVARSGVNDISHIIIC